MRSPRFDAIKFSPETVAEQVLEQFVGQEFSTYPLPIDSVAIARDLGAKVFVMQLEQDVSAMLEGDGAGPPRIYLNYFDSVERRRFSCGHEIGHLLRRQASGAETFGFIDRRSHLATQGTDPEERWANRFAAALVMPLALLRGIPAAERRYPEQLAPTFGVSISAMANRIKNLSRPR